MIIMVSSLAIAFAGAWFGLSRSEKQDFESGLTMANVEALTQGDDASATATYSYMHINCYGDISNSLIVTGVRSVCWKNELSNNKVCHKHECQKECSYNPN